MIILNCDQHRNLSFVDKKYRILQGEHKFDVIKINMPESIDGVDDIQGVSIKMHFVSGNEHIDRQVVLENDYISTDIDYTLTEKSKRWLLYLAFYVNVDGEVEIGKTNAIAIQVNKLPYSDTLAKEYKEPEIVLIKGDKGDPGEDGKSAYEIAVEHGYEGTEEEWLSEMKDYNELDNKPQINGVTLSGNKTSDDLNLQGKLTAGENITISDDNVISAEGGSNDYTDLTNKPSINHVTLSGNKTSDDLSLQGKLTAGNNITINNGVISASGGVTSYNELENKPQIDGIRIEGNQGHEAYNLFGLSKPLRWMLNFGDLVNNSAKNGVLNATIHQVESLPEFMNPKDNHFIIFDYQALSQGIWDIAVWIDAVTNEPKIAFRAGTHDIYSVSDWVELTGGGSQIVSGVVNANGTITFTDSDGNTFTTSGSSVIGADGFSPVATVTQTASGATVSITDSTGTTTANISNGQDGNDYILTAQDKSDIADIVLSELPTTQGVQYGN